MALGASPLFTALPSLSFGDFNCITWVPDAHAVIAQVCGTLPATTHRLVGVVPTFGRGFDMPLIQLVLMIKVIGVCVCFKDCILL